MRFNQVVTGVLARILPRSVKKNLVSLGFNLDRDQFQSLATKYLFAPHMRSGLESLAARGFDPKVILDIGAYEGDWAQMAQETWVAADLILVEANPEKHELLRRKHPNAHFIDSLLGSEDGKEVTFNVMESGSSVFNENSPLDRYAVQLKQRALDAVIPKQPDLIKIDVQGYELEVLKGGLSTLSKSQVVIIELSLLEINQGAPLLHEALNFMKEHGFVTYDLFEIHRRPLDGAMNQVDFVFVPENSPLRADKRHW